MFVYVYKHTHRCTFYSLNYHHKNYEVPACIQLFPNIYKNIFWLSSSTETQYSSRRSSIITLVSQMRLWKLYDLPKASKPLKEWSQNWNSGLHLPNPTLPPPHLMVSPQGRVVQDCRWDECKRKLKCEAWKPLWNLEGLNISKRLKCHAQNLTRIQ